VGRPASLTRSAVRARRRPGPPSADAKLELVESLLRSEEVETGAARALAWLGEHMGVSQALCLVVDEDLRRLVGLVGLGLPPAQVRQFSVGLRRCRCASRSSCCPWSAARAVGRHGLACS
jgi:hypothetical protein